MWYFLQFNWGGLTFKAETVELAGNVGDEASSIPAKAKFVDEVGHHAVQGFIVSLHRLRSQHVLRQQAPHRLPLLALAGNTYCEKHMRTCWGHPGGGGV